MLSNPVYTRRVAWGKRRTEKVPGKDNEYRLVKQDEYILSEVISHEAFVSKEDFDKVQEIKAIRGKKGNHNIGQYNAHLLSGIVKCPQCGAPMYIGMTKWTNQDGTERRTESYVCSYATKHRGTSVCRRNGVVASQVEDEVMEYTRKIVRNPRSRMTLPPIKSSNPLYSAAVTAWNRILTALPRMTSMQNAAARI